jgi:hypothetical protein
MSASRQTVDTAITISSPKLPLLSDNFACNASNSSLGTLSARVYNRFPTSADFCQAEIKKPALCRRYHTIEYDLERLLAECRNVSELAWRPCRGLGYFPEGAEERN